MDVPDDTEPGGTGIAGDAQSGDSPSDNAQSSEAQAGDAQSSEAQAGDAQSSEAQVGDAQSRTGGKRRKFYRELALIVTAAVVLTILVKAFALQVYRIPSASMDNTLLPGDRVLVNKLVYHFRGIDRGDIVVFSGAGSWGNLDGSPIPSPPSNPVVRFFDAVLADIGVHSNNTYYIKRVIGLPGDRVACCTNGLVTVNGVPLHETGYLYPGSAPSLIPFHLTVPPGRLWVMGDNRQFSDDSRMHDQDGSPDHGTVPENEVTGRATLIIWPLSRFGDLPIPATFQQTALKITQAAAVAVGTVGAPLLLRRRRRSRSTPRGRVRVPRR